MPGPTPERPRAQRLNDIEPQAAKDLGCNRNEDFGTAVSSGSKMGSIARFPKLDECAHFHYEHVELGGLEVTVTEVPNDGGFAVRVTSGDTCWTLQRSYENFVMFDKQLHRCIFDRKFSSLIALSDEQPDNTIDLLVSYFNKFTKLNHEGLNCGPVLNWLQLDNRGRRILVPESDSCPINTPAVAAAYAVRPYTAQAQDEISFQVGDMISVIDMPPPGESNWWRGKKGFAVGFFPAECVAVIGDKVPRHLTISTTVRSKLPVKPVLRKHGKLIAFFRSFILNRPSRRRLKQSGILKERVFGCDLGEHLLNSGHDVPAVLTCCAEFIETHGLVDGIYRLSGVTSNIQRLRHAFDEDRVPALHSDESILQDIHSVASLLKMYFRELPNPLCTYQLYSTFVSAVQAPTDSERLRRMRDAVRKLPPPHYRTLEYLMRHLVRVAACGNDTGMTPRNVAIVWAPNLLRCKELEVGGVAALQGVGVQAVVTEFLVCYAELIFGDQNTIGRPKSLAFTTPARLLSLEEARNRTTLRNDSEYIEVGAGPKGLPQQYHTVIELPRKRNGSKRSPSLNWRSIFGRSGGGSSVRSKRGDSLRQSVVGTPPKIETIPNSINAIRRLRPVKSADSLDGEDSLGPLLSSAPNHRPCGHSRSVSHDSYFDHLADGPSSVSPLDLSEIQLNFDLEEREMRMLSEEEEEEEGGGGGGGASVEASPRRARTETPICLGTSGGSKRKRSRLEERLQCDVELRFIDSQSPDQVMVTADIHNGGTAVDTPSPLMTPGYLPLLSEASTPLSPATTTLQATPITPSPTNLSRGSRISFRSFTLPLEIGDGTSDIDKKNQDLIKKIDDDDNNKFDDNDSTSQNNSYKFDSLTRRPDKIIDSQCDQEMRQCDTLRISIILNDNKSLLDSSNEKKNNSTNLIDNNIQDQEMRQCELKCVNNESEKSGDNIVLDEMNDPMDRTDQDDAEQMNQSSSPTDLDSPMSCEHTIEDLPDSGFVICDSSDKLYTNTETQALAAAATTTTTTTDSSEWIMIERTSESIITPTSEPTSPKEQIEDTLNPAIATDPPASDNISRTSLDLTMGSTLDTDTSCIGTSDFTESPILAQDTGDISFTENNSKDDLSSSKNEQHSGDCQNGNKNNGTMEMESSHYTTSIQHNNNQKDSKIIDNENNEKIVVLKKSIDQGEKYKMDQDDDNFVVNNCRILNKISQDNYEKNYNKYTKHVDDLKRKNNNLGNDKENIVIPSENAAEAHEIAHDPEGASEATSLDSSCTFSNASSPIDDSVVLRDTAAILQELALQRLSGGPSLPPLSKKERKNIDTEINRDRKLRLDIDIGRGGGVKVDELTNNTNLQCLPPCLRARHARSTRAALSRSLDEGKFNRMTLESSRIQIDKSSDDANHLHHLHHHLHHNNQTINIGGKLSGSKSAEKLQSKNLGGIDLGDPRCRERIEKYKEERRNFLRDKYRSESFRGSSTSPRNDDAGGEQALLARLKQRASRSAMH